MSDNNIIPSHRASSYHKNTLANNSAPSPNATQDFKLASVKPPKELWARALNNIKFYDTFYSENGVVDTEFSGNGTEFKMGDKKGIVNALKTLSTTPRGKELLNNVVNSPRPLNITSDMGDTGPFMERGENLIHFDGRDRYNKTLKMKFPASVILGHEMGHLPLGGLYQDHVDDGLQGGGRTNNVEATENPIRKSLGLPLREFYIEKQGTETKTDDKCYSANGQPTACPKKLGY